MSTLPNHAQPGTAASGDTTIQIQNNGGPVVVVTLRPSPPDDEPASDLLGVTPDDPFAMADEWDEFKHEEVTEDDAVARVRQLHRRVDLWTPADCCDCGDPSTHRTALDHTGELVCVEPRSHLGIACGHCQTYGGEDLHPWPCLTIRTLDDAQAAFGGGQR